MVDERSIDASLGSFLADFASRRELRRVDEAAMVKEVDLCTKTRDMSARSDARVRDIGALFVVDFKNS